MKGVKGSNIKQSSPESNFGSTPQGCSESMWYTSLSLQQGMRKLEYLHPQFPSLAKGCLWGKWWLNSQVLLTPHTLRQSRFWKPEAGPSTARCQLWVGKPLRLNTDTFIPYSGLFFHTDVEQRPREMKQFVTWWLRGQPEPAGLLTSSSFILLIIITYVRSLSFLSTGNPNCFGFHS